MEKGGTPGQQGKRTRIYPLSSSNARVRKKDFTDQENLKKKDQFLPKRALNERGGP